MCFLFFQANFILVPFPTHRQQVPSLSTDLAKAIMIELLKINSSFLVPCSSFTIFVRVNLGPN